MSLKFPESPLKKYRVPPPPVLDKVRKSLVDVKKSNDAEPFKTCCATVLKYLTNIVQQPAEDKFRWVDGRVDGVGG